MYKKIIAAVLSAAVLAGFAGCDFLLKNKRSKKKEPTPESEIEDLVDTLEDGFNDFDPDKILDCTDWDSDDEYYAYVTDQLDRDHISEWFGAGLINIYEVVARTIEFDYDTDDLEIDGDKATWEMEVEILDWEPVFFEWYKDYDEALAALREQQETVTYNLRLKFKYEDDEWKVTSIYRIEDILAFTWSYPLTEAECYADVDSGFFDTWDDDPGMYADLSPDEYYQEALKCFLMDIDANSTDILAVEEDYGVRTCVLYDIDADGIPELFNIREDWYTGHFDFDRMSFTDYGGSSYINGTEAAFEGPGKIDKFIIWFTGDRFVMTYGFYENGRYTVATESSDFELNDPKYLSRVTDESGHTVYLSYNLEITADEYYTEIRKEIDEARVIFVKNWDISPDDPEYAVCDKPELEARTYRQMHEYLENQIV